MNRLLPFALALVAATMFFTACGDDSGSGASDEISMNSSDDEGLDAASSSGKTSKNSSSSKGSTAKSSESAASSTSVIPGTDRGSSSSGVASSSSVFLPRRCEEGAKDTVVKENSTAYMTCRDNYWRTDTIIYPPKPKVYPNMDRQFDTEYDPVYGEFTDPRDGQVYKTVVLYESYQSENTIEVFAQNLNYGEMVDSSVHRLDDGKVEKYCELNDEWFCENGWGGRYTWSEAMGISSKYDSVLWKDTTGGNTRIHQGICPEGWHIMNGYEWENYAKGTGLDMASKANWGFDKMYVNSSGMSVLFDMRDYELSWMLTDFVLPQEMNDSLANVVSVNDDYVSYGKSVGAFKRMNILYIRCVKDY
ncbi:FISUMP domain-containing protein [Fibrobacter sp. HC4]|uniref:FISUMP domain-containing protein n=1 Tax=Fibrobacter sp. HC4 TaxID=3239812 RepID=UPI0020191583|nr:FISUMP domain-containing protein [Fibrobacter succinogenes]MCL4102325.1 hypothetical protein [Fibrobacter succinogenes]